MPFVAQRHVPMVLLTVQVHFSDQDADVPVCCARQVFVVLKAVEVPQLQFSDVKRDLQLQYIDKVSPSLLWRRGRSLWFDGVVKRFMAMVQRWFFCCFLAAFFRLPRQGWSPGLPRLFWALDQQ